MTCGARAWFDIMTDIMTRTIISLDPQDKAWLDRKARKDGVAMTQVVREAVRRMRQQEEASFEKLLKDTSGIWRKGNGLTWQRKLRKQW
jgi:hypothetical protein